jgi:hypothetical protein
MSDGSKGTDELLPLHPVAAAALGDAAFRSVAELTAALAAADVLVTAPLAAVIA